MRHLGEEVRLRTVGAICFVNSLHELALTFLKLFLLKGDSPVVIKLLRAVIVKERVGNEHL